MKPELERRTVVERLRREILGLQGMGPGRRESPVLGLGPIEQAFPGGVFPRAAVHEFISDSLPARAATAGFLASLAAGLISEEGWCLWIGEMQVFPCSLKAFGLAPERVIFAESRHPQEKFWILEEALRSGSLGVVVAELGPLSFTESRRLQLAVENSRATGLVHRFRPPGQNQLACVSRWRIRPLPGEAEPGMPGLAAPRWEIRLEKVRNGQPGVWELRWENGRWQFGQETAPVLSPMVNLKTG